MKIQNQLIAILLVAFLFSCNTRRTGVVNINSLSFNLSDNNQVFIDSVFNNNIAISNFSDNMNWDDEFYGLFFFRFMLDKSFQRERTEQEFDDLDYGNFLAKKNYSVHIFPFSGFDDNLIEEIDDRKELSVIEGYEIKTHTFLKRDKKWFLANLEITSFNIDSGFLGFIYKFSNDASFRNSHTKFPLKFNYLYFKEHFNDTTKYLTIQDLSDLNLNFFKDKYFYFFHNGIDRINSSNYVCLSFRGIENGISVWYYFERKEDTWQLIEFNDYST